MLKHYELAFFIKKFVRSFREDFSYRYRKYFVRGEIDEKDENNNFSNEYLLYRDFYRVYE